MQFRRWFKRRALVVAGLIASIVGSIATALPWVVIGSGSDALRQSGIEARVAADWIDANVASFGGWVAPRDALLPLAILVVLSISLLRSIPTPEDIVWPRVLFAASIVGVWTLFEISIVSAASYRVPGVRGRVDAGVGVGLSVLAAATLVLVAVSLLAVPGSTRDDEFRVPDRV